MKNLLILSLVLVCASSAFGAVAFTTPVIEVQPSQMITIALHSDTTDVFGMQFDVLSSNGGEASAPALATAWGAGYEGFATNANGTLLSYVNAAQTGVPPTKLGGDLFGFTFHVPQLPASSYIVISAGAYGGTDPAYVATMTASGARIDVIPGSLVLHVIPEPMTMALLAIGGLVALRRRHA
jgi:hypothetical protein